MLPIEDLYAVLGVAASASPDEIKRRYRQLVKQTHPDVLPADGSVRGELFLEIRRAYEILVDSRRRADYDTARAVAAKSGAAPTTGAREVGGPGSRDRAPMGRAGGLGDFVRQFFGGAWSPEGPLADEWSYTGLDDSRSGSGPDGRQHGGAHAAQGQTEVYISLRDAFLGRDFDVGGLRVRIPPGARHGSRFRVPPPVGEVTTFIRQEAGFRVEGDDLQTELFVDDHTKARGGELRVDHPAGQLKVTLPGGLRDGQLLRLRGRGLPATATRRAGDLLVRIRLLG